MITVLRTLDCENVQSSTEILVSQLNILSAINKGIFSEHTTNAQQIKSPEKEQGTDRDTNVDEVVSPVPKQAEKCLKELDESMVFLLEN